jgi:hypothetical protein
MSIVHKAAIAAFAIAAFGGPSLWSGDVESSVAEALTARAEARVGRPLTPVSYAGVARRSTRRAVAACAPVYDSHGRVIRAC